MFDVGDVVIPSGNHFLLVCGSGVYSHAIVIQAEPLVLVSESADMRWGSVEPTNVVAVGVAKSEVLDNCMKRL